MLKLSDYFDETLFNFLSWEDAEPTLIEDLLKNYKKKIEWSERNEQHNTIR